MKFIAVVDKVLPHERLVGPGVRETYKNVVHLVVADKDGVIAAQQPQSEIAGTMELHIPADVEWDAAQPGLLVNVEITARKEVAPSTSKSPSARKSGSSTRSSTSRSSGKSTRKRPAKARSRASSTGSTASRPGRQRTPKAKPVTRVPSDQTSPETKP